MPRHRRTLTGLLSTLLLFAAAGCGTVSKPAVARLPVTVVGAAPSPAQLATIGQTIVDLENYWSSLTGRHIQAHRYVLWDGTATGQGYRCGTKPNLIGSAAYCRNSGELVMDTAALVPVLNELYSPLALRLAIAHEFGHLVAVTSGDHSSGTLAEARADCAAGAFGGPNVDAGALRMFADFGAADYGSGTDRVRSVQYGMAHGGLACANYLG